MLAEAKRRSEPAGVSAGAAPSLRHVVGYFLRLGAIGFGGPIALSARMQRDLVDARGWFTRAQYLEGLALAQLAPGPLAAQLAIYLGWLRAGVLGATLVGFAFVLPSFVMVLILAALYVHFGGLPGMQAAFYGIGAAVIAVIARGAGKLAAMTLRRDRLLWSVCAANAIVTAWVGREIAWLFLSSGVFVVMARRSPLPRGAAALLAGTPLPALVAGGATAAGSGVLWQIAGFFTSAGVFVFGSGLAIVPFLRGGVVDGHHWLNDAQFLDAVAVAMITPGPVVITVAFIGYLVAGVAGAVVAAAGVFVPCWLIVLVLAPFYRRVAQEPAVQSFVAGVTAAASGALAGAVVVLGRRALNDVPTVAIAVGSFVLLIRTKRVSEPALILIAGALGLLIRRVQG
jgi:chromate transporter